MHFLMKRRESGKKRQNMSLILEKVIEQHKIKKEERRRHRDINLWNMDKHDTSGENRRLNDIQLSDLSVVTQECTEHLNETDLQLSLMCKKLDKLFRRPKKPLRIVPAPPEAKD